MISSPRFVVKKGKLFSVIFASVVASVTFQLVAVALQAQAGNDQ